jgi:uncharacterized low-complexity protein
VEKYPMSSISKLKPVALAVGAAFATTLAMAPVANAAENPFAMTQLHAGYKLADNKATEGNCGGKKRIEEGNCGSKVMPKGKEGTCGDKVKQFDKTKEANCGANKPKPVKQLKEGKCGEGKCGANKDKK